MRKAIVWTEEMVDFLKSNLNLTYYKLSQALGVSDTCIRAKVKELGLIQGYKSTARVWKPEEIQYLVKHYPNGTMSDIADYLGITAGTVKRKVDELGLKKAAGWDKHSYRNRYVGKYSGNLSRLKQSDVA